jgi:hypothetical protein
MLPCYVIVQDLEAGDIEVSAVDPFASMQAIRLSHQQRLAVAESYPIILKLKIIY